MEKEKRTKVGVGIIVIGVIIVLLIAVIATRGKKVENKNEGKENLNEKEENVEEVYEESKEEIDLKGTENVEVKEDMSTVNTSSKVKEEKQVAGLKIQITTIEYTGSGTQINGTITNDTGEDIDADFVKANIKDSKGETFRTIEVYIGKTKAGASKALDITTQADISNVYDIEFEK